MGREEGGGFRMGNTCIPVADYVKFKNKIKFKPAIVAQCLTKQAQVFWSLWERERVGRFGRMALKHV